MATNMEWLNSAVEGHRGGDPFPIIRKVTRSRTGGLRTSGRKFPIAYSMDKRVRAGARARQAAFRESQNSESE